MRVLVISHLYPGPADPAAGVFVHDQVRELVGLGCDVQVICPTIYSPPVLNWLRPRWRALRAVARVGEVERIPVHYARYVAFPRLALLSLSGYLCYQGIAATAERVRSEWDFDLLHAHTALPDGFAAMLLNRRWRKPLVLTIHGYDATRLAHGGLRRRQTLRAMRAAGRIICVSRKLMQACVAHHPRPEVFRVVHNGFRLRPARAPVPRHEGTVLLSVGNLIPLKGHRYVLEALAALRGELPSVRHRIVGDGPARRELEALTRQLGLADAVEFLGRLPHESLMAHYEACDIFVLPSSPEGFGIAYLEAMAHGKPVIACQGEGITEVIEDGRSGLLVPPRDSAAVEAALRRLVADREAARRIGEAGREAASGLTWRRNAERVLGIYRELAGSG